jgi:hypothetical protein
MSQAARLYLNEVVNNPSFLFLKLFLEDDFIATIHAAFESPQKFLNNRTSLHFLTTDVRSYAAKSFLLSPNLNRYTPISVAWRELSAAEFYRELKNNTVRERVREIILNNLQDVRLAEMSNFYKNKLIDLKEFSLYLDSLFKSNTKTSKQILTKGSYFSFISDLVKDGINDYTYSLIFKFISLCTPHSVRNLVSLVDTNKDLRSDDYLKLISDLYRDFVVIDIKNGHEHYEGSYSKHFSKLVWKIICSRNLPKNKPGDYDFNAVYEDIKTANLDSPYVPHMCQIKLNAENFIEYNNICRKLYEVKSDEALKYFFLNLHFNDHWNARGDQNNPEQQVLSRIDKINSQMFYSTGTCLYRATFLDVNPRVLVDKRGNFNYRGQNKKYLADAVDNLKTGRLNAMPV